MKHSTALLTICLLLGGCGQQPAPTSSLARPSSELMEQPKPAPQLVATATVSDLLKQHAQLKAMYGTETTKLRGLQRYVKALHGDK